ncbi:Bcr/CflA family drug resistance efflux transporter [Deltaproteobacteria bacterium Smac51]|nr:Bcr/CflA family drug resistance efflux transporter [Deltaproteobacteria bacterium Smac51]
MSSISLSSTKKAAGVGLLVLLGALTAFDSVAIDMYLPAFKTIEGDLGLGQGMMQMSLSVFLLGLAVGQGLSGPLVDSLGRRAPLLAGIVIFGVASAVVAMSVNFPMLMVGRFAQGLGGAAGLVIPRAIVSDLYEAKDATKIFTFLIQVQSISPIAAPLLGGLLLNYWGWESIFWILVVFAALALAAAVVIIPETHPASERTNLTLKNVMLNYWSILKNRRYLGMSLSAGLIMGTLFGYISASSFIFMTYFSLSAANYSFIFAANSIGMIIMGQLNFYLCTKMSSRRNLALGFMVHLFFMILLMAAVLIGLDSLKVVGGLMFVAMSSLSLIFGGITAESMYSVEHSRAGSASALLGVLQYAIGGAAGIVLGVFHDGTLIPIMVILCVCSAMAMISWILAGRLSS